jgi:predicted transglutaminase-like protease
MKFKKIIYFILAFALFYIIVNKYIIGENKFTSLKQSISKETKTKIKKYLFPYKYMSELQNTADMLSQTVEANNKDVLRLMESLNKKDLLISAIPEKIGYGEFNQKKKDNI